MKSLIALVALAGILKYGECAITVWEKPDIAAGASAGTLVEKINNGVTTGTTTGITITATGTGITYGKVSQNPASPVLDINSSTGVVTVTSGTVSYSTSASFELVVTAADTDGTVTATVTLNVNAAPAITSHSSTPCIADASTAGADLIDLAATDSNSGTTFTWAIASGNTNTDFTIDSDGLVEVASGKTLAMATTASYTLQITVSDGSSTALTATTTVTASVQTTCPSSSVAVAISLMTILAALVVTKLF